MDRYRKRHLGWFIPPKNPPIKTSGYLRCILDISGARWGRVVFLRAIKKRESEDGGRREGGGGLEWERGRGNVFSPAIPTPN